jgi:hypothetical protein
MTGTNCDLFTHKSSRSHLNHLVYEESSVYQILIFHVIFSFHPILYHKRNTHTHTHTHTKDIRVLFALIRRFLKRLKMVIVVTEISDIVGGRRL